MWVHFTVSSVKTSETERDRQRERKDCKLEVRAGGERPWTRPVETYTLTKLQRKVEEAYTHLCELAHK